MNDGCSVCDDGHVQVVFRGYACPWCYTRGQLNAAQKQIEILKFQVCAAEALEEDAARGKEQLSEALLKIELLENTIDDLNLRIAFLES